MNQEKDIKPVEVLMLEDNEDDIRLTIEAMNGWKLKNNMHVARNGLEGLAFLRKEGDFADAPEPDIILLDLNMPRMDGREFLEIIKSDPEFRRIPVVILTTSELEEDIAKAYDLHANCYIAKPVDLNQFSKIVRAIDHFWFSIVKLPKT